MSPDKNDDFDFEPIPGLPEALPEGEQLLWQGRPDGVRLGREAFRVRWVVALFGLFVLYQASAIVHDAPAGAAVWRPLVAMGLWTLLLGGATLALLGYVGRLMARETVYSITNKRVVMRFGLAMPMSLNLPFTRINAAQLRLNADGSGDIPLVLAPGRKLAYAVIWPNARPLKFFGAEPMLRAVPDAQKVARLLAEGLALSAESVSAQGSISRPVRVIVGSPSRGSRVRPVNAAPSNQGVAIAS